MKNPKAKFDIAAAFRKKQELLKASHFAIRNVTDHPSVVGEESELDWAGMIRDFLPGRYSVGPIFAVDHRGCMSDQIDVAVYDAHFAPQWFGAANGARFVPAESVYGVFEVKPQLSKRSIEYARDKVASVRRLDRTSAPIIHAGGHYRAVKPADRPIIGGLLAFESDWSRPKSTEKKLRDLLPKFGEEGFLNIGIALNSTAFAFTPRVKDGDSFGVLKEPPEMDHSPADDQLIYFAIHLFRQLQLLGTALSVDMATYETRLTTRNGDEQG
jgi:hypothetical protein